jgi:hypothetical protein
LDERSNLLPPLAVLFEALEEETMFFCRPATGVFGGGGWLRTGWFGVGSGEGEGGRMVD